MTTSRDGTIIDADRRSAFTGRKWVRWTKRMKGEFLDELAATCHVRGSAEAIGVSVRSLYHLRRRDPDFAAAWEVALGHGYVMLETLLVGHALAGGTTGIGARLATGDPDRPEIDTDLAIKLLSDLRRRAAGRDAVGGPRPRTATREETNATLLRKLAKVEARLGLDALPPAPGGAT